MASEAKILTDGPATDAFTLVQEDFCMVYTWSDCHHSIILTASLRVFFFLFAPDDAMQDPDSENWFPYNRCYTSKTKILFLQHPLARQLNLSYSLTLFPTSLADTYGTSVSQFHLVFDRWERAGAVMWEVDTGKSAGAEVI